MKKHIIMKVSLIVLLFVSTLALQPLQVNAAEEQEGNNSLKEANKLVFTATSTNTFLAESSANLANNDDADYYELTLEQAGHIEVRMSGKEATSFEVILMNKDNSVFQDWYTYKENTDKPVPLFNEGLDKGTYYLLVNKYDGEANNTPYSLEVEYKADAYGEKEFNDEQAEANVIELDHDYTGYTSKDNRDYYKFNLEKDGEMTVNISFNDETNYTAILFTEAGVELENWYTNLVDNPDMLPIIITGLSAGTYYLAVEAHGGKMENKPYTFNVNFTPGDIYEKESNENMAHANYIRVGDYFYKGYVRDQFDMDYYRFSLPVDATIDFSINRPTKTSLAIELFDQKEKTLKYMTTSFADNKLTKAFSIPLKAGTYYVKIKPNDGEKLSIPYMFFVTPKIVWGKMVVTKHMVGKINVVKKTKMYKLVNKKLMFLKDVPVGSEYSIVKVDSKNGFYLGDGKYITNNTSVKFTTLPNDMKLKLTQLTKMSTK